MRKNGWSEEEELILMNIYVNNTKEFILNKLNRSWPAIWSRAFHKNLRRDSKILKKEMQEGGKKAPLRKDVWTTEEDNILKQIYEIGYKQEIEDKLKERSWGSIRGRASHFGLKRDTLKVKKDNIEITKKAMLKKYGIEYSTLLPSMQEKSRQTNFQKRGFEYPSQSPEVREKVKETIKKNNSFTSSDEELNFYNYLIEFDSNTEHQVLHPVTRDVIDFYMPRYNLWVQYDGYYWHGKYSDNKKVTPRSQKILIIKELDKKQNEKIPNLIRFWSDEVIENIKKDTIKNFIEKKLKEKQDNLIYCHQYKKKLDWIEINKKMLNFDYSLLKASDFILSKSNLNNDIINFIKKYEWLENIGIIPKWCFIATYKNNLAGVVLINEPTAYSKILGNDTKKYEALIQRGATASWTPKNLGSRLIKFSCNWMIKNTEKRVYNHFPRLNYLLI